VYTEFSMHEVTVKYKSAKALKALQDLAKIFDIVIEKPVSETPSPKNGKISDMPITFAQNPDVKALAGIWQGRDITLETLRKEAWGDRI
jgi:hypothetical protein